MWECVCVYVWASVVLYLYVRSTVEQWHIELIGSVVKTLFEAKGSLLFLHPFEGFIAHNETYTTRKQWMDLNERADGSQLQTDSMFMIMSSSRKTYHISVKYVYTYTTYVIHTEYWVHTRSIVYYCPLAHISQTEKKSFSLMQKDKQSGKWFWKVIATTATPHIVVCACGCARFVFLFFDLNIHIYTK